MDTPYIKSLSYNVNGLNNPVKRKIFEFFLKEQRPQVVFIQETHKMRTKVTLPLLAHPHWRKEFSAYSTLSSRGVSILLSPDFLFVEKDVLRDPKGRHVFIQGLWQGILLTLASIYAPNKGQLNFIHNTLQKLFAFSQGEILIGADMNLTAEQKLDRQGSLLKEASGVRNSLRPLLMKFGLIDVYRHFNGTTKDYTFFSARHNTYSRIDYILLKLKILKLKYLKTNFTLNKKCIEREINLQNGQPAI
uniref:exodeoxyribonuclease III n=1 Tax=Salvator merianae TaxID=96440 RepID=A0A8D0B4H5_SALMN